MTACRTLCTLALLAPAFAVWSAIAAAPAAKPATPTRKAPVDTSTLPPEKMSVLQLREEVHRLRVQAAEDRKKIIVHALGADPHAFLLGGAKNHA